MDRPVNRSVLYAMVVVFVSVIAVAAISVWYANRVQQESNRNWCDLVVTLDTAYQQTRPSSPLGQQLAEDMHNLRVRLGCP